MVETSVIIVNYNGKEHLKECFDSLVKQTYKNFETILVDNGSFDGSKEFVEKNYPSVIILSLRKNEGYAKGNNSGINVAKGKFILLLNNDTYVDTHFLQILIHEAKKSKEAGMFSPLILLYNQPKKINSTGLVLYKDGVAKDRGFLENREKKFSPSTFGPSGAAALYRREMLDEIRINDEYLDGDFFAYTEDLDIAFRARLMGWGCKFIPSAIVYHKVNATSRKFTNLSIRCGARNKLLFIIKNYPLTILIKFLPLIILRQITSLIHYVIKLKLIVLKAKIEVLFLLPKMLRKRKIIQGRKRVSNLQVEKWFENRFLFGR